MVFYFSGASFLSVLLVNGVEFGLFDLLSGLVM